MSGNSGDNWDLIGDVPGERGALPNTPGFQIADHGALMARIRNFCDEGVGAWEENRRMHSEDLSFIYNSEAQGQWDPASEPPGQAVLHVQPVSAAGEPCGCRHAADTARG